MAGKTPRVESEFLIVPTDNRAPVRIGSRQWYSWLSAEENTSFFFTHEAGSFTARKEQKKRGGLYWIAYRSREGKLSKTYLGRSENLTAERLRDVASRLTQQKAGMDKHAFHTSLLKTARLAPPSLSQRGSKLLERVDLLDRLDESLRVKLTLVTAPAGFGKTVLLSMWYERCQRQRGKAQSIGWVSLDERDNDPVRYWSVLWRALRKNNGSDNAAAPISSTPHMSIENLLTVVLTGRHRNILIIDDYHLISDSHIHEGMAYLLAHLPPDLHLIVSSRSEPPWALARERMYGELCEVRASDLRLTGAEIERFLANMVGITLSGDEQELLEQRTEGWIAGLYLVGRALQDQQETKAVLTQFGGNQRTLFNYFAEEVFVRQPQEIQHFLLSTAPLAVWTMELCAAVLQKDECEVRKILMALERENVFLISLDERQGSYRYHALFAEYLQEKLTQSSPEVSAAIQRRAATWYEQQGMYEEAIEYALAARDVQEAGYLIERIGEEIIWKRGEVGRLLAWMRQLPEAICVENSYLQLLYAWALLLSGQENIKRVEALVTTIESRLAAPDTRISRGDIAALRARIAAFHNDVSQVILLGQAALQELPQERALLRADVSFSVGGLHKNLDECYRQLSEALHISLALGNLRTAMFASRYLAQICIKQGRLSEAEAILRQALHNSGAHGEWARVPATGVIHIGLAELYYERNEVDTALRHALLGVQLGEHSGEIKVILSGSCILAHIFAVKGEIERGWQEVHKANQIATMGRVPWLREYIAASTIHLALQQGDNVAAQRALCAIGIDVTAGTEQVPPLEQAIERLLLARFWLAEKQHHAAATLLVPLIDDVRAWKHINILLAAQTLQAIALYGMRMQQQAAQIMSETLSIAQQQGWLRMFLDIGTPLQNMLEQIEIAGSGRGYARRLLEAFEKSDPVEKNKAGLSEREVEVLHLLAAGLSNQEIADALVVAVSTVKAHVRHVCQKLNVRNRLQAVAQARTRGLL
ncbi:LuxR C-terminal-related transcriptional regulator [Dictyobacter formicarum]|uniref:LuxR family transcriptional regulator n=1 Tax=Dictyobacter formicarum TaxID=2778368 RepID=A0ABQ3VGH5_9CHLR|nr:LuxR C-terminal-related transcriptional regulator [Dictyobacter formicarum]GHO84804.1 LuxR family transcriptional regulator [Dictyobacter formicarum]